MNININAGMAVQNISVSCDSSKNWLYVLVFRDEIIILRVRARIDRIKIILWSWKNIRCSIVGEFLFCENILDHIGIYLVFTMVWLNVCSIGGRELFHSIDKLSALVLTTALLEDKDSHKIYIKNDTEIIDRYDPIEDTMFHEVNASG